ncbi:branched-chain amino acid ABC transporter permease [Nakamurella leprariae]|uniref:Branched-chain amino acid ABC transporter permease n=1 Tax=Nakamurella leprariae TaxID=2803911 RepID=A0A939C012_9ACTN|nr:branched-chain amino acid ABC transporter permease [Nakamurella leprariae]MBM9465702.1 branched-chain amino acid ABC transporter permease [Nakamurella leprariae]
MTLQKDVETQESARRPRRRLSARAAASTGRGRVPARLLTLAVVAVAVLAFGFASAPSVRYAVILSVIYAIAILGNNAVLGLLGEMNLSGGVTMALGAYGFCWFSAQGMNPALAAVTAVLLTALVSAVIAIPTTRLRGIFTALATFALAYAIPTLAIYLKDITGGDEGTSAPYDFAPFGLELSGSTWDMLTTVVVIFVLLGALSLYLFNARPGTTALVVGEAELAGTTTGISHRTVKVVVWTWAGTLGGIAGVLYALAVGFIGPTGFSFMLGVWILVGGVIAGPRSVWGALLGGLFVGLLPVELQSVVPPAATGIIFGAILLIALLAGGRGLAEWIERAAPKMTELIRRRRAAS